MTTDYEKLTKQFMSILRQLENTSSTTAKREMIRVACAKVPEFKSVLTYALDPYIRFGIARFPSNAACPTGTNTWYDIDRFLQDAAKRDMTLTNLNSYLLSVTSNMNAETRELFKRVLLKDLRCGVGATLVNSVFDNFIPQFSCMLATLLEPHHCNKLQGYIDRGVKVYGQPKLNGDRAVSIIPDIATSTEMLSRKGFTLNNYQTIATALYRVMLAALRMGIVFDGEVIVGDFFKTRGTKKLAGNEAEGAVLHVFDCVLYDQWRNGETDTFSVRQKLLREIASAPMWEQSGVLIRVPTMLLTDVTWDGLNSVRDKLIAAGNEGLIVRPDLPYDFSSSARANMYKHKTMDNMDCVILEIIPGDAGKKMENVAARMLVELPNGQTCEAGMGKGLNMDALAKLWRLRGQYVGLVAEIAYQDKTVNQSGEWKLQFPKFTGKVRKDKS